jgi:hypothetical protein
MNNPCWASEGVTGACDNTEQHPRQSSSPRNSCLRQAAAAGMRQLVPQTAYAIFTIRRTRLSR